MQPLYLDEKVLLLGIGSSYVAIVIFYYLIKNNLPHIYKHEKESFSNYTIPSLKPKILIDYLAYFALLVVFAILIWDNLFPVGFQLGDEIAHIFTSICDGRRIQFTTYHKARFFPFGHQEWSILAPLLAATNCNLYIPFSLVVAQTFVTAYLLFCIIPFEKLAWRLFALAIIISNASFFTSFSTLMIPDRNTVFLLALFLYCLVHFFKTEKPIYLLIAFICANTALYFKETMFVYFVSFAFTAFCFHLYQKQFRLPDIFSPLRLIRKQPLEILLPILSLYFIILWFIFAVIIHPDTRVYGASDANYIHYIVGRFYHYPLFSFIIIMVIGYSIDIKNIQKHQFSLMLFVSGLLYALAMSLLKREEFYYYTIAELSIILAGCYYLKNISWQKNLKWRGFALLLVAFSVSFTIKSPQNLYNDLKKYKIIQYQFISLQQNLPLNYTDTNHVFYYSTRIPTKGVTHLTVTNIRPKFRIEEYSFYNFSTKNADGTITVQFDKWNPDDYDVTIIYRNSFNDAKWQSLQAQYGERLQRISDFPSWMGNTEGYNIYILQNENNE